MNPLEKKYPDEVARILANYPPDQKRAAVMPLLHLAQNDAGFISLYAMKDVADLTEVSITDVASIVGYYTLYHDKPEGRIRLQVCTDVACALRGAREYLAALCNATGIEPGGTTSDGMVTIEEVKCLADCDRAPLFQTQVGSEIEFHDHQTAEKTLDWLRSMTASMKGGER